ncbi:MAG: hypothetical protein LBI02_06260, partial [Opitutaceae bacterium]|nr:hypothetical protein [Opitutaceae bacterium]
CLKARRAFLFPLYTPPNGLGPLKSKTGSERVLFFIFLSRQGWAESSGRSEKPDKIKRKEERGSETTLSCT